MNEKEKQMKRELIATTKAIKKKFQELHNDKLTLEAHLQEQYEPITKSLKRIIENQMPDEQQFSKNRTQSVDDENVVSSNTDGDADEDNTDDSDDNLGSVRDINLPNETPKLRKKGRPTKLGFAESENYENLRDGEIQDEIVWSGDNNIHEIVWSKYDDILLTNESDTQFGVRKVGESLKIGNYIVKFHKTVMRVRSKSFPLTRGLLDLLFYKKPPPGYTTADLQQYKNILILTSAHKKFFDTDQSVRKSQRSYKYKNIISPILKSGAGIDTDFMTVSSNKIDYTYWDNANELVERLRLLVSSASAGHTGHNNEIISIIEELREANIIQ